MSEISTTDVQLWKRLANPDVVNVEVDVRQQARAGRRAAREVEKAMNAANEVAPSPKPPSPRAQEPSPKRQRTGEARAEARSEARAEARTEGRTEARSEGRGEARDDERIEKQGILLELRSLEQRGIKLSKAFDMGDSLAEMEFELNRHLADISTQSAVAFMRDTLRILLLGVEGLNSRLGPFVNIDGWAESVTSDMHRYDHALERIYKRYWRRQQVSPLVELAWLLLGSMMAWHFQARAAPTAAPAPRRPAPRRPTMRPPGSALFGQR